MEKEKKTKVNFKTAKSVEKSMEVLKSEVTAALNDEKRVLQDSKLAVEINKEIQKQKTAGVGMGVAGAAAGVAGVAGVAHFGAAVPLIISTSIAAGLLPVTLIAAAGTAVVGTVVGVVGGSKVAQAKLDEKKRGCIEELKDLHASLVDRRELEKNAVQERCDLLDSLIFCAEDFSEKLKADLRLRKMEKKKSKVK